MTYFVMALAMVLGLAQCKKEQPAQNETEGVFITLTLDGGNSNSRVNVDPTGNNGLYNYATVQYEEGDVIYVGYNGSYVGQLTCQSGNTTFSGNINVTEEQATQPLDLYFLGGKDFALPTIDEENNTATLVISDQTASYPVISYARSTYQNGSHHAKLMNKCSIMKFNVTTPSNAAICIEGMNNQVSVNFGTNAFTYGQINGGLIKMKGGSGSPAMKWAIVLPNSESTTTTAYTEDGNYIASISTTIDPIVANNYYDSGIGMNVNTINPTGPLATPLTFEAKTAGATVKLKKGLNAPNVTLEYSTDGSTWTSYSVTTSGVAITLDNIGDKVMFRGTNTKFAKDASSNRSYSYFSLGGDCYVYGNVMSLINSTDFATTTAFADGSSYNFCYLFKACTKLYNHPTQSIVLPATTLVTACYCHMFDGCTNLTSAPDLPATTLAIDCYAYMFCANTNLAETPDMSATTLADYCYLHMFDGCYGLTTVPATLPVTTLANGCYQGMFKNCTSLTTAPELPAPTLVVNCYQDMFWGCSALTSVTCLATDINASGCVYLWLKDVTTTGTLHVAEGTTSNWTASGSVPSTWAISEQ